MIELPRDAPGSAACGRNGLPLLAICPHGHRGLVPFRVLKTSDDDRTPLYGRPFVCSTCGSREVLLSAFESQEELEAFQKTRPPAPLPGPHSNRYLLEGAKTRS